MSAADIALEEVLRTKGAGVLDVLALVPGDEDNSLSRIARISLSVRWRSSFVRPTRRKRILVF